MDNLYDYKKFAILYVDDEEKSLKYFERAFGDDFRVLTASNAQDGFKLLQQHDDDIGLLLTDQRMPGEKGVWLLEQARHLRPRILRFLVTAYSDFDAAIAAVNSGAIYRYVSKPWDPPQLELTLRQGLEFFMVQAERDQLLHEKMSVLRNMMIADRIVSLGLLAAGLSHNIRNPLVAVKTFLDLAPKKMDEERANLNGLRNPEFWNDYHQNVQSQIEKINGLLQDLWSASENPSAPFAEEAKLSETVGAALAQFKDQFAARRIQIENRISASLPALKVDKPKFNRLFELLLTDELAMLPAGSRVTLSAELRNGGGKPEIVMQLRDNGPGLPQEALRVIFDPFVVQGSVASEYGIHLMACFFIVHHHGGTIDAQSQPGGGTTFTLRLPLNPERVAASPNDGDFLRKAMLNESLWQKLIAGNG
ncbi:MAG TPA: hybrid sensor histidine kinase/response regulator, partial [Candidatus Paceibacterota bacterium]|nr:hybrid sensor histidine kinase/response regulator [Candidatus Paceibacterota bacterium]